jgi:hypothetical protein
LEFGRRQFVRPADAAEVNPTATTASLSPFGKFCWMLGHADLATR